MKHPLSLALAVALPLGAQAGKEDVEALKKQIQALTAGQIALQKQLEELSAALKAHLQPQGAAAAAAPSGPPAGTLVGA